MSVRSELIPPHRPRRVLVTGGAGFIGSAFVRYTLESDPSVRIVTLDALTYAGRLAALGSALENQRHLFVKGDIRDSALVHQLLREHEIDTIVHFAAESHVDRSIAGPAPFIMTNVIGTFTLLEAARDVWRAREYAGVRFHHVSTDEVFGTLQAGDPPFTESSLYLPNSPYSASKAGSDHLVRAYWHTYGVPFTGTNCSNNFGPYQHAEKFVPTVIRSCLARKPIPIYGTGMNVRDWLYVEDHCRAIESVLQRGTVGEMYLVGARNEWQNLEVAQLLCRLIAQALDEPAERFLELITPVTDRLGHDFRYAIDPSQIERDLGWRPVETFENSLRKTVDWYLANRWSVEIAPPTDSPSADRISESR